MANSITIDISQFTDLSNRFKGYEKELREGVEGILQKNAAALSLDAKNRAPVNLGGLHSHISAPVNTGDLEFTISSAANYSAFVEFGTGKYAAQYVATLPQDWQTYARSFKGKSDNAGFDKFLERILEWVKKKQIGHTYNIQTRRRDRVGKQSAKTTDEATAYFIAIRILQNGIRPQPFLYPAYTGVKKTIITDIENLLKSLNP